MSYVSRSSTHQSPGHSAIKTGVKCVAVLLLIAGLLYGLWLAWPTILLTSVAWQQKAINQLSDVLYTAEHSYSAMWILLEISFIYGVFHSVGPGHGKVVVSTYLATHRTKVPAGIALTAISALVQALVAIILVSTFLFILHATMHELNGMVNYFFYASYIGVMLLGIYLIVRALRQYFVKLKSTAHHDHDHDHDHDHVHQHDHNGTCACGHHHVADADALNNASSLKEYAAIVLSIGLRPCSGAILILFFSYLAHEYWLGVLSSILMAVGTAITTSTLALLTVSSRKFVSFYMSDSGNLSALFGLFIKLFAGLILILFSIALLKSGTLGGMSPLLNVR